MGVKNYDAKDVQTVFANSIMQGLAEDTYLNVTYPDAVEKTVGVGGEVARSQTNDKTVEVELTVLQTSSYNDILSAQHRVDQLTGNGVTPFAVRDRNGTTLVQTDTAWVRKFSDIEYGKGIKARVWTIDTGAADSFVGGATLISGAS